MKTPAPSGKVTRQEAGLRQLHVAIRLLHEGQYESAINLAVAAETAMPKTKAPAIDGLIEKTAPDQVDTFDSVRDWLGNHREPDMIEIHEADAVIALLHGTARFSLVYPDEPDQFTSFNEWCRTKGFIVDTEDAG